MVSLKDISAVCGVSVATVSKALNNQSDIGEKTKRKIRQTAKEMGYFPNSAAIALKTNRTNNIGVLFVDEAMSGLTHDYFAFVLDSFKRTAEEHGYDITFINCSKMKKNRLSYLEHARSRAFDGVVIACIDFNDPEVIELVESDIPVVTIDHEFDEKAAVISDNYSGMRDLIDLVYERGHRKIAYIHGADSSTTKRRLEAYTKALRDLNLEVSEDYCKEAEYRNTSKSYRCTQELLDMKEPPTCIFYPDDFASFGGMKAISERGLRIPEDISIVGYDGIRVGRHINPQLTTLKQNTELIGMKAAESLMKLIESDEDVVTRIVVKGEVYEGGTVSTIID